MKTLFIDTHLFDIHIVLLEETNVIREKHVIGERYNSTFLVPSLKEVCDGNEFDQIIVCNGPGSFTGVRLGVTIAKTLAYTKNIPIKVISSLDMMAYCSDNNEHIFGISDGNGYFIGIYNNFIQTKDYFYLSNGEYGNYSKMNKVETDVSINYGNIITHSMNKDYINPHLVKPVYIKLIGVEYDKKD